MLGLTKILLRLLRNEDKLFPYAASAVASWIESAGDDLTEVAKDYEKQCQQARGFDFLFLKQKTNNNKHQHPVVQNWMFFFVFGVVCFFFLFFFGKDQQKIQPTRMFSWGGVGKRFSHQSFSLKAYQDKVPFNAQAPKEEVLRLTKVWSPGKWFDQGDLSNKKKGPLRWLGLYRHDISYPVI